MGPERQNDETTPERVGHYYDEWTAKYQVSFGNTFQACRPTRLEDLHHYLLQSTGIQDGERILDAGCGVCGPSIYFAAHRDITIDAVTVSRSQVEEAQRLISEAKLDEKITVHLADFHKLRDHFPEATFDRVIFLESLSHAADPAGPLQSALKVLKPGGSVYIKDFFVKEYANDHMKQRALETIARVDQAFVLKTPHLHHTVGILKEIGFIEQYWRPVGFNTDIAVWADFNRNHKFDLYGGGDPLEWCEWIELHYEKPVMTDML